jgi:hypothetical protein
VKEGDTVWTIAPEWPKDPYRKMLPVTLNRVAGDDGYAFVNGCRWHKATELFPTETAAWLAYRTAMYARIKDLGEQVAATLDAIHEAENRIAELNTTEAPK